MPDDMVYTQLTRKIGGIVGRAIVDDEPFHRIEPGHFTGQGAQRDGEGPDFVEAGYLDDEFHAVLKVRWCRIMIDGAHGSSLRA